jgi:Mg-chelatase subunit ChlD
MYVIETEDAYYNMGILYKIVQVKGGKLIKIEKIHIEEVE